MKFVYIIIFLIFFGFSCKKSQSVPNTPKSENHAEKNAHKLITKSIEYKDGEDVLEGYLAYDPSIKGKRPGILVAHPWMGLDEYTKGRTRQFAEMGYIAFALDTYGKGVKASDHKTARKLTKFYRNDKDRTAMRNRAKAGLNALLNHSLTDKNNIVAVGYCFGGATVLELGRSGANLKGIVTFHGSLDTPHKNDAKNIKGRVLILHGGSDPKIPPKDVENFNIEMEKGGVKYSVIIYPKAMHSFTIPSINNPKSGSAYDKDADMRSWDEMKKFLSETFK